MSGWFFHYNVSVLVIKTFSFRLLRLRTDLGKPSISSVSQSLPPALIQGEPISWLQGISGMVGVRAGGELPLPSLLCLRCACQGDT